MEWLFARGHAVDIVLAVLGIEAVWLAARGRKLADIALLMLPAVAILLALRGALTGASWHWIALPLALSFPVHLADLRRRFRARED